MRGDIAEAWSVEREQSEGRAKRQATTTTTTTTAEQHGRGKTGKVDHADVTLPGVARRHHDATTAKKGSRVNRGSDAWQLAVTQLAWPGLASS